MLQINPSRLQTDRSRSRTLDCPACGGAQEHVSLYIKNHCEVLRCSECGLGRAVSHGFDPAAYYTDAYFSGGHADGYPDYRQSEPILRREFARTMSFVRRFKPSGRLLEIGCAHGFLLKEAQRHFDVVGLEMCSEAAAEARSAGLDVVCGAAEAEDLQRLGRFDVIVMLDVIEHLQDPFTVLATCARQLEAGGIVVLTTGDFGSLVARLAGANWRLMTPPQHLWFFTPDSLRKLTARVGLELERIDHPWKLVPLSLIDFQLRRMLGIPSRATAIQRGIPVNLFDAMRVVASRPRR